jgi:ribosome assembly protein YihI (activator of Der GTPase)
VDELYVLSRRVLLDALEAIGVHLGWDEQLFRDASLDRIPLTELRRMTRQLARTALEW